MWRFDRAFQDVLRTSNLDLMKMKSDPSSSQVSGIETQIDRLAAEIEDKVIEWRRDFHQHPELSNREFRTSERVADYMKELGLEVETGIAHTGVVALLEGSSPGPVVALRADMDALPVTERTDVPFASRVRSTYEGQEVGVMHACGHDTHMAMLMGAATVLTSLQDHLPGTVKLVFQPAEEGTPRGEEGGAELMVREGALKDPDVDVIFGLHVNSMIDVNTIEYTPGPALASSDDLRILIRGEQTHGASPWEGADAITAAAHVIAGLQTVVSRRAELTRAPAVVSIGKIQGGVRTNILPEEVEMVGTIRTFDQGMREKIHREVRKVATRIAESMSTVAEVEIETGYPVTYNDLQLASWAVPRLQTLAGLDRVSIMDAITGAEDFSFFQQQVPGFFFFLGGKPKGVPPSEAAPHHAPDFYIDESGLKLGVRALSTLAVEYLTSGQRRPGK